MERFFRILVIVLLVSLTACDHKEKENHVQHNTLPVEHKVYTCPMHPQIVKAQPGRCPICGMDLVKIESDSTGITDLNLTSFLKPPNEYIISGIPVTAVRNDRHTAEVEALGKVEYDTRMIGTVSSRVSGRIEKLYIRYKYQHVERGQIIMDIYSPELVTAQQNLLFISKNDKGNVSLLQAARQKLLLMGMSEDQVMEVLQKGKPMLSVGVYSNYTGHIHNAGNDIATMGRLPERNSMSAISLSTELLSLKEGMYVQSGQTLFSIYNPSKAWISLSVYADGQSLIKKGQMVTILPEAASGKSFQGKINFIEPFYREGSRTTSVRVSFENSVLQLPIGSQVRALIKIYPNTGYWLPKESVTSLGIDKIVFIKVANGFMPRKIKTGILTKDLIQVYEGLSETDSVAVNAQFLIDSESFIRVKE